MPPIWDPKKKGMVSIILSGRKKSPTEENVSYPEKDAPKEDSLDAKANAMQRFLRGVSSKDTAVMASALEDFVVLCQYQEEDEEEEMESEEMK